MDEERIADGAYGYDGWNHPPCEGDSDVHRLLLNRSPIRNRYFLSALTAHKEHAALGMRRGHCAVTGWAGDGLLWLFFGHTSTQSSASMSVWDASQPINISPVAVFIVMQGRTSAEPFSRA